MRIGVLALQGDFAAHAAALTRSGAEVLEVRHLAQLPHLAGLVMPGGESTSLLKLMSAEPWFEGLRSFVRRGGAVLGTCAGAILLAREVRGPRQPSLALIDAVVERNGYGRQVDSFEADVDAPAIGGVIRGAFIRAPRFVAVGNGAQVIGTRDGEPVLLRQNRVIAGTFHPEITLDDRLHQAFLASAA